MLRWAILLVNRFHELADDEWYTLYPLDLFLRTNELPLQAPVFENILANVQKIRFSKVGQITYLCSSLMYSSWSWMYLMSTVR